MASSLQPHPACNAPTGMTKGKLSMTELQRQALGNMANKRTTNTQLDTKVNIQRDVFPKIKFIQLV